VCCVLRAACATDARSVVHPPKDSLRNKKAFLIDMDGVIYHGNKLLPGVVEFVDWLKREEKRSVCCCCRCWPSMLA